MMDSGLTGDELDENFYPKPKIGKIIISPCPIDYDKLAEKIAERIKEEAE